jgi:hypothetical protein
MHCHICHSPINRIHFQPFSISFQHLPQAASAPLVCHSDATTFRVTKVTFCLSLVSNTTTYSPVSLPIWQLPGFILQSTMNRSLLSPGIEANHPQLPLPPSSPTRQPGHLPHSLDCLHLEVSLRRSRPLKKSFH